MTFRSIGVFVVAMFLVMVSPAMAVVIIDQENDEPRSGYNDIGTPQWQSFMQAGDNIAGAAVVINRFGESGTITLSIYDAEPGTGTLIASGSGSVDGLPASADVFFSVFWTAVSVIQRQNSSSLEVTSEIEH